MPRYQYGCLKCNREQEKIHSVKDCDAIHLCKCGHPMTRMIQAVNINCDFVPYVDENMGPDKVYITSRQHRKEELKKRGLTDMWGVGS